MWRHFLFWLFLVSALEYAGTKRLAKVKGCKGEDGTLYKHGESIQEGCYIKRCYYIKRKYYWKSKLNNRGCCQYEGAYVPNGWTKLLDQKLYVCMYGKFKIVELIASPPIVETVDANTDSIFQGLLKRERVCTQISSLHMAVSGTIQLIGHQYQDQIIAEITKIVNKYEGEQDYVCGLENEINLFPNTELKQIVVQRLNEVLKDNGHNGIVSKERTNFRNGTKENRVIGGAPAFLGQFPFQARFEFTTTNGHFLCGGVLISPCYVLTAKYCADDWKTSPQDDFSVFLGDINRTGPQPGEQQFGVHFVHLHPRYDIALLLLDKSPTQSAFIAPIKLSNIYPNFGERAIVSGWGQVSSLGSSSILLRWREIDLPSFWWCHQYIQNNIGNYFDPLAYDELCGGDLTNHTYAGACAGDTGGPLARRNPSNDQWELIGLVKRGVPNCPAGFDLSIYTSVVYGPVRWWIDSILDKSTNPGFGGNCRCNARGTKYNNALQNAWWDGANCVMEYAPVGCGSGGFGNQSGQQFVWSNKFYITPHKAVNCPIGGFDSCYCYLGGIPSGGSVGGVCPNPLWGPGNIFLPGPTHLPPETCAFEWSSNRYTTPQGTGSPAHCPKGYFDGSNCNYYSAVPVDTKAFLFPWNPVFDRAYYYGYPAQTKTSVASPIFITICFPASSKVVLADGSVKAMENILIGDHLLAISPNGKQTYSKFIGWLHKEINIEQTFLKISTATRSIKISSYHLIMRKTEEIGKNNEYGFIFAKDINQGDFVYTKPQNNSSFTWQKVIDIESWFGRGVFAPLTEEGTVVVDGMVASCYAEALSHVWAHAVMTPVRIFPYLLDDQESQHLSGIRTYLKWLIPLSKMFGTTQNDLVGKEEEGAKIVSTEDVVIYAALVVFCIRKGKL